MPSSAEQLFRRTIPEPVASMWDASYPLRSHHRPPPRHVRRKSLSRSGLTPEEDVLTPERAKRLLRDKAEREAKIKLALELWEQTPVPRAVQTQEPVAVEE